jgi:uncharacterized protein YjbJ (UPF0337 family)
MTALFCWPHNCVLLYVTPPSGGDYSNALGVVVMNTDQAKGKLKQLTGEIKRKWGQLTDDDLRQAQGSMEKLVGKIQERSGDQREEIERWFKEQGLDK